MPYERSPDKLDTLIDTVLADSTILKFIKDASLHPRHVANNMRQSQEEAWNAAGAEIEDYNKADAHLSAAKKTFEDESAAIVAAARWHILPFVRLPPPTPEVKSGWIALTIVFGIAVAAIYFFAGLPSLAFVRQRELPAFSEVLMLIAMTGFLICFAIAILL